MTESDYWYNKSSRDAMHDDRQHESRMNALFEQQEYNLVSMLKPKIMKDGDQWHVLYGENIVEGISGFGDTPYLAILDFNKAFSNK